MNTSKAEIAPIGLPSRTIIAAFKAVLAPNHTHVCVCVSKMLHTDFVNNNECLTRQCKIENDVSQLPKLS